MEKIKEVVAKIRGNRVVSKIGQAFLWLSALFGWAMALILVIGA